MVTEWYGDDVIKKIAKIVAKRVETGAEVAQDVMKAETTEQFHDTGTLNRSITIEQNPIFRDVPVSQSSPDLGKSGVKPFISREEISLFIGTGQHYVGFLFKYGYGRKVVMTALRAAKGVLSR